MVRRAMLIPRARRVRFEREMLDLEEFLEKIREAQRGRPYWQKEWPEDKVRKVYADEVE